MNQFRNNLAYEASAGSGKTFMLVVRYLSLLFNGANPSKILALTFTNKAASEMQERVIQTLEELETRQELYEIVKVTGLSRDIILKDKKKILENFLNSNTKIMTIDKFFTRILRKFSLYASLMPNFSTFKSQHELKLLSRFLKEVSVSGKRANLIKLSLEYKKSLQNIIYLLDELYIKKHELSNIKFVKVELNEFKSEALKYLKELQNIIYNSNKASSSTLKAVDIQDFNSLLTKPWLCRDSLKYRTFSSCYSEEMDNILPKIKDNVKKYMRAKEQNFFYALIELLDIYEKSKKALYIDDSELSFSDVTTLVHFILREINDSEFLYFRLDAEIEHILLDEFQDTSIIQYEILKPLIDEIVSGNGIFEDGSFFFVGDVKQSIYRFRGGVSALFNAVKMEQNTEVEPLLTNYRSKEKIIDFVNETFKNKIVNYAPQLVRENATGGYVEIIMNDKLIEETIIQVKRLISLGADINEIAVLSFTNQDGEAIKMQLQEDGIEVVTETTTKLIHQRGVKAILEYLKYLYFLEDIYRYNFFALINMELKEIKKVDLSSVKLFDLVKNIIDEYKLFNDDFHLVRFLNILSQYQDIEALLFEYERLDKDAAASDIKGVRVLTIHKSKGLEYQHLIVMDRIGIVKQSRNEIIYEYDYIKLKNLYLKLKNRECLDLNYAQAIEKENALVREDNLNALYVAFTRAKENLFIVMKSKKSSFDILNLKPTFNGDLICTKVEKQQEKKFKKVEYKSFYYGTQSDILKLENNVEDDLKAINFGLSMHYMLEMLGGFEIKYIQQAKNMMLNKYGSLLGDKEIEDITSRISRLLNNNKFLKLVDGEYYKEKGLRYKKNLRYIDLLIKNEDGEWIIIDYKSSDSYSQEHLKQVEYYIKAVKEITKDKRVHGYVCYLLEDSIKWIKVNSHR